MKQVLVPAVAAETSVPVPESEPEATETDVPEDVQEEIRELAAQEYAASAAIPLEAEEAFEDFEAEPGGTAEDVSVDSVDSGGSEEGTEAESPSEPPQEPPKPPRTPRRYEVDVRAPALKAFLAVVGHLVDEAKATIGRDGIHVIAVDPAHVALVDVTLADLADICERKDGRPTALTEPFVVGLDMAKLTGLLKRARKEDVVRLRFDLPDEEDKDRITVSFGSLQRTMAALDTADMSDPRIPALDLPTQVRVAGKALYEAVKAASEVSDHIRVTVSRDGLNVKAEGDIDVVSIDLRHGEDVDVELGGSEERYSSLFPIDYLVSFLKVARDETMTMHLGTDYPVRADWDGGTKGTYLLAPRIEASE